MAEVLRPWAVSSRLLLRARHNSSNLRFAELVSLAGTSGVLLVEEEVEVLPKPLRRVFNPVVVEVESQAEAHVLVSILWLRNSSLASSVQARTERQATQRGFEEEVLAQHEHISVVYIVASSEELQHITGADHSSWKLIGRKLLAYEDAR